MKPVPVKYLVLLFFISLGYTFFINWVNLQAIRAGNSPNSAKSSLSLVYNSTVYSVDNYWYVNQVKNVLAHGRFTADITKEKYEVRRTPVYPVFYGIHYMLFGEAQSYYYIRFTQAGMLALAVVLLFLAMYNFTGHSGIAWVSAAIYGLYPAVPAATFYTVTESISSELVCYCLYFLSLCKQDDHKRYWFLSGLLFALAALCRPTIVFLSFSCAWLLWYTAGSSVRKFLWNGIFFAAGALLLFAPWTIRNYKVTGGDIVMLEKFYGDPMDYGMPNIHLRKWISCWNNPADFTSENVSNAMRTNIVLKEPHDSTAVIRGIIEVLPERAYAGNSRRQVEQAFYALYRYYQAFMTAEKTHLAEAEASVNGQFIRLTANFQSRAPFDYYVLRPLIFLKSVIFQSNAQPLAFLEDYRTNWMQGAVKGMLYLVNVLSWFSLIGVFFFRRIYASIYWMTVIFVSACVIVIIGVFYYYEARYNIPMFPLLFGLLSVCLVKVFEWSKNKFIQ
jgi:Dolichyl-phosphate-mannose-protein mannosyltransferase